MSKGDLRLSMQTSEGAGPPAHEGARAPYAPVGRYPFE